MDNPYKRFFDELQLSDRDPKTKDRYKQIVCSYKDWLEQRQPDPDTAKRYIAHLRESGYAQSSLLLFYHVIRLFLSHLGMLFRLRLRKPRRLPPYHHWADIELLLVQAERGLYKPTPEIRRRNGTLVLTLAYTGLRRAELLSLRVGHIDFEGGVIRVQNGKGGNDRTIPLAGRLRGPLKAECANKRSRDKVFEVSGGSLYRIVRRLAVEVGRDDLHPHSFRHMFATRLVEQGVNLRDIQALLGHRSLETTAVYLDVTGTKLKAAIDRLD